MDGESSASSSDGASLQIDGVRVSPHGYVCRWCGAPNAWRNAHMAWNLDPNEVRIGVEFSYPCVGCQRLQLRKPDAVQGEWQCTWCESVWAEEQSPRRACLGCGKYQTDTGRPSKPRQSKASRERPKP